MPKSIPFASTYIDIRHGPEKVLCNRLFTRGRCHGSEVGRELSPDDRLRKAVIGGLFCGGRVDLRRIAQLFGIDPRRTLRAELEALKPLAADGLVEIDAREIRVTERGQFFVRNVALVFDAYHGSDSRIAQSYSRAV